MGSFRNWNVTGRRCAQRRGGKVFGRYSEARDARGPAKPRGGACSLSERNDHKIPRIVDCATGGMSGFGPRE